MLSILRERYDFSLNCGTTNRQMVIHLPKEDIQLLDSPVSEVNRAYSAKRPAELSEFSFDGMNISGHKFDDVQVYTKLVPRYHKIFINK